MPLGVNLDLFQPAEDDKAAQRPTEILYVGRLSREKDLPTLLDAFGRLTPASDFRLTVVGEGPLDSVLRKQAQGDSRIRFLGGCPYGEGLARIYSAADILAVPSPNETFNLTVLEGFASGLPVAAVRQGGPRHLVAPEVGELANPSDPADFARKLEVLAKRRIPASVCRGWVEEHYSWKRTFDQLLDVYERSAREKRAVKSA